MKVLNVRNVHEALPRGLALLEQHGYERDSRNGPVRVIDEPVSTVYSHPLERVCFWSQRDANPFFHLYESLWMLAGRNDLAPLVRYVKDFGKFSDDGSTLHGAYGFRWRVHFGQDQLMRIVRRLKHNPDDRRCVLQMWDAEADLGREGKDVPCNLGVTVQRGQNGELNIVVPCRSNDIIWGAYGANAVHFGFLLEYLATAIGCQVGTYTQMSINYHAYLSTLEPLKTLAREADSGIYSLPAEISNPYKEEWVSPVRLAYGMNQQQLDQAIEELLFHANSGFALPYGHDADNGEPFFEMAYAVLRAHHLYSTCKQPDNYKQALATLQGIDDSVDWVRAARQWIQRRADKWDAKQAKWTEAV